MAGDWIKMREELGSELEVLRMAELLGGVDPDLVIGKLLKFWSWAGRVSRDGHGLSVTVTWVDCHVKLDGFCDALLKVGWLGKDDQGFYIPHFERHNGENAKKRALATKRKQKERSSVTHASRSERDKNATREEERREENIKSKKASLSVENSDFSAYKNPTKAKEVFHSYLTYRSELKKPIKTQRALDAKVKKWAAEETTLELALAQTMEREWIELQYHPHTGNAARNGTKPIQSISDQIKALSEQARRDRKIGC